MTDNKITPAKLQACIPFECSRGKFLQLPFTPIFATQIDNTVASGLGTGFLTLPSQEMGMPAKYPFLIKALSALVSLPYTYMRVQWPNGHYLSNVPVNIYDMMRTGRNGRLLCGSNDDSASEAGIFTEPGDVVRMEFGTQSISAPVQIKIHFEGCLLIPA